MSREQIIGAIKSLASSQGFYSRLYRDFMELFNNDADRYDEVMSYLEEQNFGDAVDMVMFFEC